MEQYSHILWLSCDEGEERFLPRDFALSFKYGHKGVMGISQDDWDALEEGPDSYEYYNAWERVLSEATVPGKNGIVYKVMQSGGEVYLVPEEELPF